MALAAYGSNDLCGELGKMVRLLPDGRYAINESLFGFQRYGELRPVSHDFVRRFGPPRLPEEPITQRHMDIARGLQHTLEEIILHVARHLRASLGERNLCFAGGTALNCLTNRRLVAESGFDQVFIPPNPNDAGVALGAALALAYAERGARREQPQAVTPYLGPSYDDREITEALDGSPLAHNTVHDVVEVAAEELARGRLVAWFQGRAEMGPRALGNRSLLADPRNAFMRELLNRRVKRREYFRPYAPAVLAERAHEFFDGLPPSPYMSFAALATPRCREECPAVLARDGTARVQTVARADNPLFYRLIEAFAQRTGIPMLLNTSFNSQEPTVCTPEAAVSTFVSSGVPLLVIGRCVAFADADVRPAGRRHQPSPEAVRP
jgi:carbamoyltransferase